MLSWFLFSLLSELVSVYIYSRLDHSVFITEQQLIVGKTKILIKRELNPVNISYLFMKANLILFNLPFLILTCSNIRNNLMFILRAFDSFIYFANWWQNYSILRFFSCNYGQDWYRINIKIVSTWSVNISIWSIGSLFC